MHHPIFSKFPCRKGEVPANFVTNFIDSIINVNFVEGYSTPERLKDRYEETNYPSFDEEYFEWIDILETVIEARGRYTMIELGAGFGRWLVNAALALKQIGKTPFYLVGVEAEPVHFEMMHNHFRDNCLEPNEHLLIKAAVSDTSGEVYFTIGHPEEWYGQSIVSIWKIINNYIRNVGFGDWPEANVKKVKAVSLNDILNPLSYVDLVDLDIQGEEFNVLEAAEEQLIKKVKRIHIGTHGKRIENNLRSLFKSTGWININDYQCLSENMTPYGEIAFQDGVQTWLNGNLKSPFEGKGKMV